MDRKELESKLNNFKQACIEKDYVETKENVFELEEAYPGMIPTPFIINIHVKNQWLEDRYSVNALKDLTHLLYEKTGTDDDALENILTLRLCNKGESYHFDKLSEGLT